MSNVSSNIDWLVWPGMDGWMGFKFVFFREEQKGKHGHLG